MHSYPSLNADRALRLDRSDFARAVWEMTLQVCVINLERSKDRLAEFATTNGHLKNLSRFLAIDGQNLDIADLTRRGLVGGDVTSFTDSALGCALSHIALWDITIANGTTLTIAEDDAIFNRQFGARASEIIDSLPAEWDVVLWGWNFDLFLSFEMLPGTSTCLAQFEQTRMRTNADLFQTQTVSPRAFKLLWAFGTISYAISPKGALALKTKCLPLRSMVVQCPEGVRAYPHSPSFRTVGIDNTMNGVYRDLNAFVCFPPLVISKNEYHRSTIAKT